MPLLSTPEEATLRRVALARTPPVRLPAAHLLRLTHLNLIEAAGRTYRLTPLGRQCFNALPPVEGPRTVGIFSAMPCGTSA